jgi:hypothetical protein
VLIRGDDPHPDSRQCQLEIRSGPRSATSGGRPPNPRSATSGGNPRHPRSAAPRATPGTRRMCFPTKPHRGLVSAAGPRSG